MTESIYAKAVKLMDEERARKLNERDAKLVEEHDAATTITPTPLRQIAGDINITVDEKVNSLLRR